MCEMGGMILQDYAYYIGMLGVVSSFALVLGWRVGMGL